MVDASTACSSPPHTPASPNAASLPTLESQEEGIVDALTPHVSLPHTSASSNVVSLPTLESEKEGMVDSLTHCPSHPHTSASLIAPPTTCEEMSISEFWKNVNIKNAVDNKLN